MLPIPIPPPLNRHAVSFFSLLDDNDDEDDEDAGGDNRFECDPLRLALLRPSPLLVAGELIWHAGHDDCASCFKLV